MAARVIKRVFTLLKYITILVVVLVAALVIRLAAGPMEVDFLRPAMERGLNAQLDEYSISFEKTILVWGGWSRGIDVRATNVLLKDHRGLEIARLPQVSVGLYPIDIVSGEVVPERIDIFEAVLSISRRDDGSFGFRRDDSRGAASAELSAGFIDALLTSEQGRLGRLRHVGIHNARLEVGDLAQRQDWVIHDLNVEVERVESGLQGTMEGRLEAGPNELRVEVDASYKLADGTVRSKVSFENLVPAILERPVGPFEGATGIDVALTGSIDLLLSGEGRIETVSFELMTGPGTVDVAALAAPLRLEGATLMGTLDRNAGRLEVSEAVVRLDDGRLSGRAAVYLAEEGEGISVVAAVDDLSLRGLAHLWPPAFKAFSRNWVATNIDRGRIIEGDIRVNIQPGDDAVELPGSIYFAFDFEGVRIKYLNPMPPFSNVSGHAILTEDALEVFMDGGVIRDIPNNLDIQVKAVHARLNDLTRPITQYADVTVVVATEASQLIRLLDYEPLGYATDYGISPGMLDGTFRGRAWFRFPLLKDIALADLDFRATALVEEFMIAQGIENVPQRPGRLNVSLDRDGIEARGMLYAYGQPVTAHWRERFTTDDGPSVESSTEYRLEATIAADRLVDLGLPKSWNATGAIDVSVRIAGNGTEITTARLEGDLTDFGFELSPVAWSKEAGSRGGFWASASGAAQLLDSVHFQIFAPDLNVDGLVNRDKDAFDIHLEQFILGETNAHVDARYEPGRSLDLRLSASSVDLRPFISQLFEEGSETFEAAIEINAARAIARQGVEFRDFDAVVRFGATGAEEAQVAGTLGEGGAFYANYHQIIGGSSLDVQTDNAGALLRALDFYDGLVNGTLDFSAITSQTDTGMSVTAGELKAKDFRITSAPGMAQVLTLGSLTGLRDTLGGRGISFDRFEIGLEMIGDRLLLQNGHAVGSQLGIKIDGQIYDDLQQLQISGTLAPAYGLNSVIGQVPIVGDVLMGGSDEGLIAFRYSVEGDVADPSVSVNPLSGLTPGFLRGIFDVFNSSGDAPSSVPAEKTNTETAPKKAEETRGPDSDTQGTGQVGDDTQAP